MSKFRDVIERVKNDRLLRLIIGEGEDKQTFRVQETLLIGVSEVFAAMERHRNLGEDEGGTHSFPDDPVCAWEVFLYWMMKGGLSAAAKDIDSSDEQKRVLVLCWILGDKYGSTRFQDEAMLEMLSVLEQSNITSESANLATHGTPPGSKIRLLVSNEIVWSVNKVAEYDFGKFDEALMAIGFAAEYIAALRQYLLDERVRVDYVGRNRGGKTDQWRRYMVNGQPRQHWLFNGESDIEGE